MKTFLVRSLSFLAIQAAILVALNTFYVRKVQNDHYLLAWKDKEERLRKTAPPRLIICGGSSSAFGFNSRALERALGRSVVNLGLHGGLGLDFMLRQAKAGVKPGDLVVVAPEYEIMLAGGRNSVATTVLDLLSLTPEPLRYFSVAQLVVGLDRGLDLVAKRPRAFWLYLHGHLDPPPNHLRRSGFNEYGDVVAHRGLGNGGPLTDRVGSRISVDSIAGSVPLLRRFASDIRARGGEVCLIPPPIPVSSHTAYREHLDAAWKSIADGVGGCVLADRPLVYPDEDFYLDNAYHLTKPEGARLRTRDLISRLEGVRRSAAFLAATQAAAESN